MQAMADGSGANGPHDVGGVKDLPFKTMDPDGQELVIPPKTDRQRPFEYYEAEVSAVISVVRRKHTCVAPTWDVMRRHIESLPTNVYSSTTYYERWAIAFFLELFASPLPITQADLACKLGIGTSDSDNAPHFSTGDAVQVLREDGPIFWQKPHLRTPGYIFGKRGIVERFCGRYEQPELLAFGIKGARQPLYRVRFRQRDLWPAYDGMPDDTVDVELYQPWLAVAPATDASRAHEEQPDSKRHKHSHEASGRRQEHDGHSHHHDHQHEERSVVEQRAVDKESRPGPFRRMAEALKACVCDAGLASAAEITAEIEKQDMSNFSFRLGAQVVARAWKDGSFKARLLADGRAALAEMGIDGLAFEQLVVVENTECVHNLVVCTLCSCYPSQLLGKPPDWYKSRSYRARAVCEPRSVLSEFGVALDDKVTVRVHDSTADMRYLVLPMAPACVDTADEEKLMSLVKRDSMVGTARD
mmetsp:Transcript_11614/g.32724  ORF Transcript_11614/g.32724 Transcript_11614/m.32724 type:complete len:472 (+) Transcript_11614:40-1455(+)